MSKIEAALEASGFDAFVSALRASPYSGTFDAGGYTVFAPSNEAFAKFPAAKLARLRDDKALMRSVLGYHFATGRVYTRLLRGKRIRAVMHAAGDVIIDGRNGLRVNGANIIKADIECGPSVVHGIDAVLWPRAIEARAP